MRRLLNQSERRQLQAVEILYHKKDWIIISDLAKMLDCSVRVLKDDVAYFKNTFQDFTIESSNNGIRLVIKPHAGLKSFYQNTLAHSTAYQLLEIIFLENNITVTELTDLLYISSSTVYRLIDHINDIFEKEKFHIDTNPCRIVGSEKYIRYFFYNFFHEKYSNFHWPYELIDEKGLDRFLEFFIRFTQMEADFAYYNIFKTVSAVNLVRFKHGYYINTEDIRINFDEIIPDLTVFQEDFQYFEEMNRVKVNNTLIKQMFTPYIRENFSLNYERLIEKTKRSPQIKEEVQYLDELLDHLASKHNLRLENKEDVILNVHNAANLEYYEPRSGYILYNHNQEFAYKIKDDFPLFYEDLYKGAKKYRQILNKPLTEDGIYFIIYLIFTKWRQILPELRRKFDKIAILVISDRHVSHSQMIRDVIEYEFHEQIVVDVYDGIKMDEEILKNLGYDIVVANFPLPNFENRHMVYVENLPTYGDIAKIRALVDEIIQERLSEEK